MGREEKKREEKRRGEKRRVKNKGWYGMWRRKMKMRKDIMDVEREDRLVKKRNSG